MFKIYLYFLLLLFLWLFVRLLKGIYRALKSYFWHEVQGVITEAKLINLGSTTLTTSSYGKQYSSSIRYEYEVMADIFESKRVSFFPLESSLSKKSIERLLSRYYVGKSVKIYYDPSQPSEALLEKGLNIRAFLSLIVILLFNGGILWMILNE